MPELENQELEEDQNVEFDSAFEEFANASDGGESNDDSELSEEEEQETEEEQEADSSEEQEQEESEEPEQSEQVEEKAPEIDYKAEFQKLQHQHNSDKGRISAFQRQVSDLQQKVKDISATGKPEEMTDEQWDQLQQDYPDIAAGIQSVLSKTLQQFDGKFSRLESKLEPLEQNAQDDFVNGQMNLLTEAHPDWKQVSGSDEYLEWLLSQPAPVQQMAESMQASDNIWLLDNFKRGFQADPAPDTSTQEDKSAGLREKRERQLRQSQTISTRQSGKGRDDLTNNDFDSAFEYFADKLDNR